MNTEREDRAIDGWCTVIGRIERSPITVVEHPDREKPGQGGCDAIVDRKNTRHAVEHTSLDTYQRRREDDDRFRKVVLPIAEAIESTFPDSWVEMEVPVHAIPTGEDWRQLCDRLLARCLEAVGSMPIASYYDLTRIAANCPGLTPWPSLESRAACRCRSFQTSFLRVTSRRIVGAGIRWASPRADESDPQLALQRQYSCRCSPIGVLGWPAIFAISRRHPAVLHRD